MSKPKNSNNKKLEYIDQVENLTNDILQELDKTGKNEEQQLEWVSNFISNNNEKVQEDEHADAEIQNLWKTLRQKMEDEKKQPASARTTKKYVKKFLNDVQTKKILFKESSKIKLTKEEEEQLKLFSKLK